MIDVAILGASHNRLETSLEGAVKVLAHNYPDPDLKTYQVPWTQYFTDDGTATGSSDMRINPTNFVDYFVQANDDQDIYINSIAIFISDNNAALNQFGALPALTNGLDFIYKNQDVGEIILASGLTDNFSFLRLANLKEAFGTGTNVFKIDQSGTGATDSYYPVIYLKNVFGIYDGLRLRKNTLDRIIFRVNDNTTGVDAFNIEAKGKRIIT